MELKGQNIFSKVDTRSERQRAYNLLVESQNEFHLQLENKDVIPCKPLLIRDSKLKVQPLFEINMKRDIAVIVTFGLGAEKYFMSTFLSKDIRENYFIDLAQPLYKLQRRSSFRVNIPIGYKAKIEFTNINGSSVSFKYNLADLSAGGFAVEYNANTDYQFQKGQKFTAKISIGGRFEKSIEGIIRHIGIVGSKGSGLQRIGAEFQNLSTLDRDAFMKITWDIHRDMFSTFKIGSR